MEKHTVSKQDSVLNIHKGCDYRLMQAIPISTGKTVTFSLKYVPVSFRDEILKWWCLGVGWFFLFLNPIIKIFLFKLSQHSYPLTVVKAQSLGFTSFLMHSNKIPRKNRQLLWKHYLRERAKIPISTGKFSLNVIVSFKRGNMFLVSQPTAHAKRKHRELYFPWGGGQREILWWNACKRHLDSLYQRSGSLPPISQPKPFTPRPSSEEPWVGAAATAPFHTRKTISVTAY